ncbi:single-stranded DNA-binding protein [Salibacterium aidingense]|uniref:single-stranded DNA-binding protein n=1 Tax=Salibacterium aidingense TaxID=384933 RepID=UPI0003FF3DFF|nr:single-stranded DNA-binding protein [Salibacterium aidingense]
MINQVVVVGRMTRDPELRYTPNGVAVTNFNLAVNRPFTNQKGEREADFFSIVAWRKQAENLCSYVQKGDQIAVSGRLQSRSYMREDGGKQKVVEVVAETIQFLETKKNNSSQGGSSQSQASSGNRQQTGFQPNGNYEPMNDPISDDDLPF